jgi:hypothetical protein
LSTVLIFTTAHGATPAIGNCEINITDINTNFLLDPNYLKCNHDVSSQEDLVGKEMMFSDYTPNNYYKIINTYNNVEIETSMVIRGEELIAGLYKGFITGACVGGFQMMNIWIGCTRSPRRIDTKILPKTEFKVGEEFEIDVLMGFGAQTLEESSYEAGPTINFANYILFLPEKLDIVTIDSFEGFNCTKEIGSSITCKNLEPGFKRYYKSTFEMKVKGVVNAKQTPNTYDRITSCVFYTNYSGQDCSNYDVSVTNPIPNPTLKFNTRLVKKYSNNNESYIHYDLINNTDKTYEGMVNFDTKIANGSFVTWVDSSYGLVCSWATKVEVKCNNWKSITLKPGEKLTVSVRIWFKNLDNQEWVNEACFTSSSSRKCKETIVEPTIVDDPEKNLAFTMLELDIEDYNEENESLTYTISNPSATQTYTGRIRMESKSTNKLNIQSIKSSVNKVCSWVLPDVDCLEEVLTIDPNDSIKIKINFNSNKSLQGFINKVCISNLVDEEICKTKKYQVI